MRKNSFSLKESVEVVAVRSAVAVMMSDRCLTESQTVLRLSDNTVLLQRAPCRHNWLHAFRSLGLSRPLQSAVSHISFVFSPVFPPQSAAGWASFCLEERTRDAGGADVLERHLELNYARFTRLSGCGHITAIWNEDKHWGQTLLLSGAVPEKLATWLPAF